MTGPASSLTALAERLGVTDLFVLQRVDEGRLVNLDGYGRGAGWAGNLSLDPHAEPWLAEALGRGVHRFRAAIPRRVFGPYWSTEAAGATAGENVVVLGGDGAAAIDDGTLRSAAAEAGRAVYDVPAAKRLADELEVTQAALAVASHRSARIEDAARHLATIAADALGCEFGAVLLYGPPMRLILAQDGWRPAADDEEIIAALLPLAQAAHDDLLVEQDVSESPYPYRPLAFDDGLRSRAAIGLGPGGSLGLLVAAHTVAVPRGFTTLCQRVIVRVARTAEPDLEVLSRQAG